MLNFYFWRMNYKNEEVFNRAFRKLMLELRKNMLCSQTALSKCVGVTRQAISSSMVLDMSNFRLRTATRLG